jgi:competence protein ComEA
MKRFTYNVAAVALVSALLGGVPVWAQQPTGTTAHAAKSTPAAAAAKVNINTADEASLASVKGIGEKKAKAIIEYREKNGLFKSVDDLTKVKGIKEKQLAKVKDQVTVE